MIAVFSGSNHFALHAVLRQRIDAFVAEYTDIGLEQIDGEEVEYDRMREALESMPFLASKKLVVLRSPSANKQFVEHVEVLLAAVPDTIDVIIVEPKLDKRSAYYKFLKKQKGFQEFAELDEQGMARWAADYAKQAGGTLSAADARFLVERIGLNQGRLANELDKLLLHNTDISRQDIELLVEATPHSTIFDLLDAAFSGNLMRAMHIYAEQRQAKVEPQQIIAMLAWQLHIVAVVKAAGEKDPAAIASDAKLSPFVVRKSQTIARRLAMAELRQLVQTTLRLDARLKREPLDADDALQHYLMSLAVN